MMKKLMSLAVRGASLLLVGVLLAGADAFAQSDEPIPYPDDPPPTHDQGLRALPRHSQEVEDPDDLRRHVDWEDEEPPSLARLDDPNIGAGGELVGGALMVDRADASAWAPRFAWGARFNWEFGRLISDELLHEALFTDVTWIWGSIREGTERIFTEAQYHYVTVAPAFEVHLDKAKAWGFYGQVGFGVAYQLSALTHDGSQTLIAGLKPAVQYGVGFRGRPLLSVDGLTRLSVRVELTRFRRAYMDDTLIAAGLGASF
jgi:hypothetical protein